MADTSDLSTWHGISIGSLWTGTGIWATFLTLVGYWLRSRVPLRKMRIQADESLRAELLERLSTVETAAADRVGKLEDKLEKQRLEYEARLAAKDAVFDKEMRIMRHRANNLAQCVDAMLMLIKAAPNDASKHVVAIEEMRARQEIAEAAEKGEIADAKIAAAVVPSA